MLVNISKWELNVFRHVNISCVNLQAHQPTVEWGHCQLHQVQRPQQRLRRHVHRQAHCRPGDETELHGRQLWSHDGHVTGVFSHLCY